MIINLLGCTGTYFNIGKYGYFDYGGGGGQNASNLDYVICERSLRRIWPHISRNFRFGFKISTYQASYGHVWLHLLDAIWKNLNYKWIILKNVWPKGRMNKWVAQLNHQNDLCYLKTTQDRFYMMVKKL